MKFDIIDRIHVLGLVFLNFLFFIMFYNPNNNRGNKNT